MAARGFPQLDRDFRSHKGDPAPCRDERQDQRRGQALSSATGRKNADRVHVDALALQGA